MKRRLTETILGTGRGIFSSSPRGRAGRHADHVDAWSEYLLALSQGKRTIDGQAVFGFEKGR